MLPGKGDVLGAKEAGFVDSGIQDAAAGETGIDAAGREVAGIVVGLADCVMGVMGGDVRIAMLLCTGNSWVMEVLRMGMACVATVLTRGRAWAATPLAIGTAVLATRGTSDAAAPAAGAATDRAFGISESSCGSASAPTGSPNPLYTIRAGTISAPA